MAGNENETCSFHSNQVGSIMHSREEKHNVLSTLMEVHRRKSRACLISLDFFKAYDRVFLPFLLKVLETMNFGNVFISWISMLHFQATTRLILNKIFLKLIDRSPVGVSQPWNLTSCFIWVIGRMNPWGLTNPNGRQLRRSFLLQGMTERI